VDFYREASLLARFNRNFARARAVSFPTPLYPLVAPDVLVESFEAGRHITSYIASSREHPYSHRLAELGSGTMLQMMLVDNLIHSDLHPGNILVRLEPPTGLLGLAYRGVGALLEATGGGGDCSSGSGSGSSDCSSGSSGSSGSGSSSSSSGSSGGQSEPPQVACAPAACGSSSRGDAVDSVSAAGSVSVPPFAAMKRRREDKQQQRQQDEEAPEQQRAGGQPPPPRRRRHGPPTAAELQERLSALRASWLQPRIVLLDAGMATELSGQDQANMVGLFKAFSQLEGGVAADWILRFSGTEQRCERPEEFRL
ncbi:hypothetical protein Rsub_12668, partial [Raphidocelis subcapitata]